MARTHTSARAPEEGLGAHGGEVAVQQRRRECLQPPAQRRRLPRVLRVQPPLLVQVEARSSHGPQGAAHLGARGPLQQALAVRVGGGGAVHVQREGGGGGGVMRVGGVGGIQHRKQGAAATNGVCMYRLVASLGCCVRPCRYRHRRTRKMKSY
eukprot:281287-Prorocentrum_minimum.AAC.1